jgi:hypothetical protein
LLHACQRVTEAWLEGLIGKGNDLNGFFTGGQSVCRADLVTGAALGGGWGSIQMHRGHACHLLASASVFNVINPLLGLGRVR